MKKLPSFSFYSDNIAFFFNIFVFQVEDVNDNAPQFVNLPYYAAVQVEAEPGSVIFMVSAIDKDYGLNGEVSYRLKSQHRNFEVIALSILL